MDTSFSLGNSRISTAPLSFLERAQVEKSAEKKPFHKAVMSARNDDIKLEEVLKSLVSEDQLAELNGKSGEEKFLAPKFFFF